MANTDIVLRDEMGLRVPSVTQVTITAGSTITFTVERDADSALYFAPGTAQILTPAPGARVSLTAGHKLTYTFASAPAGAYGVITQAPEDPAPTGYNFGNPADPPVLVIQPGQGSVFTGPTNEPQT
jgi:hypothetical protein